MILLIILSALVFPAFLVRWWRWLAIVQQKEYRLDRIKAFLHSDEGKHELLRILPQLQDFSRTGLKRPKPTARVLLIGLLNVITLTSQFSVSIFNAINPGDAMPSLLVWGTGIVASYLILPISIILDSTPSMLISFLATWRVLRKAKQKMNAKQPKIIGIGGSYGKTSTKHLLHHFLSQKFSVFVTPKSFNNKLSVAQSIVNGYQDQEVALLEYGAYIRGEIAQLSKWFPPSIAVETGYTPQHLSLFGSRENSILAESELIAALPENGVVYCNGADPGAVEIAQTGAQKNHVKIVMYSGADSRLSLEHVTLSPLGHLQAKWNGKSLKTQLIGKQYLVNLQAAMLIAQEMGMSEAEICAAAESFQPNASFIEGLTLTNDAYLIDDGGTSNPMGFSAALELLSELPFQRKILVTAGMIDLGKESRQIHFQLAKRAKELGITVIHVGIDGRDEFREVYAEELVTQVQAAEVLLTHSDKNVVILIEGKLPKVLELKVSALKVGT